jgi:hypothetical protein
VSVALVLAGTACGHQRPAQSDGGAGIDGPFGSRDGGNADATGGGGGDDGGGGGDGGGGSTDAGGGGTHHDAAGVISGGPCISGASGATAYRIRWAGSGSGSTAYAVYEVDGLPDQSRDHAGAYGYQIGFTPTFVDPFLGDGGLQLDGSDFVDLEITTVGIASISQATLSIYGRSYNTTASGSFNWQTFVGTGSTDLDAVSNVAPYQWYSADMTTEIAPGDGNTLVRIKAGGSSDALVVNRIELCLVAN